MGVRPNFFVALAGLVASNAPRKIHCGVSPRIVGTILGHKYPQRASHLCIACCNLNGSRKGPQSVLVNNGGPQKIFPVRKYKQREGIFQAVIDKRIYTALVAFILYLLPLPSISTANAHTHTLKLSSDYLLDQMDASTSSHPSSSFDTSPLPVGNNNGFIPNPGMYMIQMPWPPGAFAGAPPHYQVQGVYYPNMPPQMLQNPSLHQYEGHAAELSMGFASSSLPQASASSASAGEKRVAEDREDRKEKQKRVKRSDIRWDIDFFPLKETDDNGNQRFECLREGCGKIIIAASYNKHIKTANHQGVKSAEYTCPRCFLLLSRGDSLKRHLKGKLCASQRRKVEMGLPPSVINQGSTSSAFSSAGGLPSVPFTVYAPAAAPSMPTVTANLQIPPHAVEVTQAPAVDAEPLLPAPASSRFPEAIFDESTTQEAIDAYLATLNTV
ncbi:hypothetical protein DFH29DRAFT_1081769 [Suillus ampliporus]|nr:hypothetical protein DFH29DRAFT_1081769 [Suillus ampliporus]